MNFVSMRGGYFLHEVSTGSQIRLTTIPSTRLFLPQDLLYVGWTEPGEWFQRYSRCDTRRNIRRPISFNTSNRGRKQYQADVNGKDVTGPSADRVDKRPLADPLGLASMGTTWNLAFATFQSSV